MTVAYDLDGVLCETPPLHTKPWRRMNGQERREHTERLRRYYVTAKSLYVPREHGFHVITARSKWAEEITRNWLAAHFGDRVLKLHMLEGPRTTERVVAFKATVLLALKVSDYSEDNRDVVRGLRKAVPTCRVWHYKGGMMKLDYPEAPV